MNRRVIVLIAGAVLFLLIFVGMSYTLNMALKTGGCLIWPWDQFSIAKAKPLNGKPLTFTDAVQIVVTGQLNGLSIEDADEFLKGARAGFVGMEGMRIFTITGTEVPYRFVVMFENGKVYDARIEYDGT